MVNTSSHENQIRHMVYILENAMLNLPQGQGQMSWLIDFTGLTFRNSMVKFTLDSKTIEKVKFVYLKKKGSVGLMKCYFDGENLPSKLGGKGMLNYNHEEFSRLMAEDDLKSVAFWGSDEDKLWSCVGTGHSGSEVAPEPAKASIEPGHI
ncbi:hypothetical protein CR513_63104, partial [Mucuna pruriens]